MKRYHIKAWGHPIHPDLDYEADVVDDIVRWNYPFLNIALQYAIPASALRDSLDRYLKP
jgi:hypothetical protein